MDVLTKICFLSLFVGQVLAYSQLVNNKTIAEGSSTYRNYVALLAVDGNTDQDVSRCFHSDDSRGITEAWLRIDLGGVYSVRSVKFWYRDDRKPTRLRGYSLRVSNDTNVPPVKSSCYTDQENVILQTIVQEDCERTARYIWIYQKNNPGGDLSPIVEICEVQVFGCEVGYYGRNCRNKCDHCKNSVTCGVQNGECDALGCINDGYQPPLCTECKRGRYGLNCIKQCSQFCIDDDCQKNEGTCIKGCERGYRGNFCNETCQKRWYGLNCSERCGNCLKDNICHHVTGTCLEGCAAGYKTQTCKTPCNDRKYGMNCRFDCSRHCLNDKVCNKIDGSCQYCADGYKGIKCNTTCETGKYGKGCSQNCGACLKSTVCNHITGYCELGCEPGWQKTDTCTTACLNGTFGLNCQFNCSGNCLDEEPCNSTDGTCTSCSPGWDSVWCNKTCLNGTFGLNCQFNCSGNCLDEEPCNSTDGTCTSCSPGWDTVWCNKTCDVTWYGAGCKFQCGHCFGENNCHHVNGSCLLGCQKGFTGDLCFNRTLRINVTPPGTLDLTVVLLIVCPVAGLLFIALCVVTMVFLSRHRHGKQKNKSTDEKFHKIEEQDNEDEESPETLDDTILYTTVQIRSKSIKTTDLPSVIKSMGDDTDKGFTEEFNSIPYGEQSDILCTVGKLPENIPKNRFKTTFPYDHSRVVLQSSKNEDYINGNFIKNTDGDAVYIASQGPKPKTVGDFWQMIWQGYVFVIAMVTNLKEGDKIKCERYWPTSGDSKMMLEIFTVQLFSERIYANFSTHNLKLFNRETQETRQITHLQYTSWPDHGTPNPLELLSFYHYVSKAMEQHPEQKLVVHCSAGIGRTGTFIALDALHRQGVKKGKINIVEYVHTMREDRMNMIQNTNQYKFLYHALYESFRTGCHVLKKDVFVQEMDAQMQSDKATNLSNFRTEFKELDSMRRIFDENEKQIRLQNLKLNMTENVLPADKMRIILSSHAQERGTYYNAVPISTFTTKDCIIAGQYPVQGAGIDLIRLLVDQDCSSLVLTYPLSEIPHSGGWFSDPSFNYRVEVGAVTKMSANVNKCNVRIKPPSSKGWHKVSMYEIKTWNPTENLPQVLLDAVKRIQLCELVDPERKLAILSRDGASRCGEFCAVYNAIQQLQQDQEVDMFTIVRQLQSRRPEMISDLNEYLLCCQAVAEFIKSDSDDTYMNSASNTVTVEENMYANT